MNKNMNLMCPIGGHSLGIIGINLLLAFRDLDIDVSLFPIAINDRLYFNDQKEQEICYGAINYAGSFDYKAPTLKIWHPHDMATKPSNGKYYVFIAPDNDYLTSAEVHHLNYTDGIFVESDWGIEVLNKHNVSVPVYKLSLGVNKTIFNLSNIYPIKTTNSYVFYSIGKWGLNNSQDFIIKCFNEAFTEDDNVELRLLPDNEFLEDDALKQWLYLIEKSKLKDKISVYHRLNTQYDIAGFINSADCYLALNRSPITSLNVLEAMSMNKPVIAINYGNNKNYCNSNNSYMVEIDLLEKCKDSRLFLSDGNWVKLSDSQLQETIKHMRYVYNNNIRTNPIGLSSSNDYSWLATANAIKSILFNKSKRNANTTKRK